MPELNYYWYHHMMPTEEREYITEVINKHNFLEFVRLFKKWNAVGLVEGKLYRDEPNEPISFFPMWFLPQEAYYENENGELQSVNILNEKDFSRITFNECECG